MTAHLQRENAALRQALADMPTCRCGLSTDEQCALSVENAALRKELDWKTERLKLLSDCLHDIEGVLKKAATSIFVDALESTRKEAQP